MLISLLILFLLAATAFLLMKGLFAPSWALVRSLPSRVRGLLGVQTMADLQRQAAAEVTRRALISISARHLPNDILVLLNPEDHNRFSSLEKEFCEGVALLLKATANNKDRGEGVPFVLHGRPKIRLKADPRVAPGTAGVVCSILEETALAGGDEEQALTMLDLGDRQIPLRGNLLIGRSTYADVRIDGAGVSREHVQISCQGTHLLIRDLGSPNGTLLNGQPVEQASAKIGDTISFGPHFQATIRPAPHSLELADLTTAPLPT